MRKKPQVIQCETFEEAVERAKAEALSRRARTLVRQAQAENHGNSKLIVDSTPPAIIGVEIKLEPQARRSLREKVMDLIARCTRSVARRRAKPSENNV